MRLPLARVRAHVALLWPLTSSVLAVRATPDISNAIQLEDDGDLFELLPRSGNICSVVELTIRGRPPQQRTWHSNCLRLVVVPGINLLVILQAAHHLVNDLAAMPESVTADILAEIDSPPPGQHVRQVLHIMGHY